MEDNTAGRPADPSQEPGNLALISLILGIVGLVLSFFIPIAGLIVGIVGLVLANRSRQAGRNTQNQAGFILSILAIVVSVIIFIFAFIWGLAVLSAIM